MVSGGTEHKLGEPVDMSLDDVPAESIPYWHRALQIDPATWS